MSTNKKQGCTVLISQNEDQSLMPGATLTSRLYYPYGHYQYFDTLQTSFLVSP